MRSLIFVLLLCAPMAMAQTVYRVALSGAQEVPAVESDETGYATLVLNAEETQLSVTIVHTVEDVAQSPGAHIHMAPAGANGDVVFAFAEPESPIHAVWDISADAVAALKAGDLYINIHSPANPPGEIRGQIVGGVPARAWDVTITNLTQNQIFSPPIVVSHWRELSLFEAGQPASGALAVLAEDGDAGPMRADVTDNDSAFVANIGEGPIPPGGSATITAYTFGSFDRISVLSMLVTTNDAFLGVNGVRVPRDVLFKTNGYEVPELTIDANAYDAGTEFNNELCTHIPGPPCGSPGVRDTANAEGFVSIHPGIQNVGDLDSAEYDWRNPVARVNISIRR